MSGEGAKERTDRVMLTPWVKFLWESYRNMLELLKNNPASLLVYTEVAKKAFDFCLKYQRRTEYRKLCEIVSPKYFSILYLFLLRFFLWLASEPLDPGREVSGTGTFPEVGRA